MIAKINAGDIFNQQELAMALGISRDTFRNNRDRILEELKECYRYTLKKTKTGRISKIHFIDKIGDYEYEAANSINRAKKDEFYEVNIPCVIQTRPLNTPANISRIFWGNFPEIKKLSTSEGTIQREVRTKINMWYGKNENDNPTMEVEMNERKGRVICTVWAMLDYETNTYQQMSLEQEKELSEWFSLYSYNNKNIQKEHLKIISDYHGGVITKEQMVYQIGEATICGFQIARKTFFDKYGKWPIRAKLYENYENPFGE